MRRWLPALLAAALLGCGSEEPIDRVDVWAEWPGAVRIVQVGEGQSVGWPDVVVASDGAVYVTWADLDGSEARVWLSVAAQGGTFSAPIRVDDGVVPPYVGLARSPSLDVSRDRVAVTMSAGSYLDSEVHLYTSARDALSFGAPSVLATSELVDRVEQPEVAFSGEGEAWVVWKAIRDHTDAVLVWGREHMDWEKQYLQGLSGQPCECCPHHLQFTPDGDGFLAIRNNEMNLREIYVGRVPVGDDGFAGVARASHTGWVIAGCPFDGPRMAQTPTGEQLVTWVDGTHEEDFRSWTSRSDDDGATWYGDALVHDDADWTQTWPVLAADASGTVWHAVEELGRGTLLSATDDLGDSWDRYDLTSPDGPLLDAEVDSNAGHTALVGVAGGGSLWYVPLTHE